MSSRIDLIEVSEKAAFLPTTISRDTEKQSLRAVEDEKKADKMPRIQHCFFTLLIVALFTLTLVSAASNHFPRKIAVSKAVSKENAKFRELLNSVEPGSLHDVLHEHMKDKYKHGVYQEDKTAMEVVHQENAEVAHSLIELAKRQAGNGTTTAVVTSTAAVTTDTTTIAVNPVTSTTDPAQPPPTTQQQSSQPLSQPPGSTLTQVSTSTAPAASQSAAPSTPASSTDVHSSSSGTSPSKASTSSEAASRSVTQQILYTTTLANGAVNTVTSVTVVPAEQAQTADGNSGSKTNTANASLQTNSANSVKLLGINGVLGVMGLVVVVGGL